MAITDVNVFRMLRYVLIGALGLASVLAGVLIFDGVYGLITIGAGGVALLLSLVLAVRHHARLPRV